MNFHLVSLVHEDTYQELAQVLRELANQMELEVVDDNCIDPTSNFEYDLFVGVQPQFLWDCVY